MKGIVLDTNVTVSAFFWKGYPKISWLKKDLFDQTLLIVLDEKIKQAR